MTVGSRRAGDGTALLLYVGYAAGEMGARRQRYLAAKRDRFNQRSLDMIAE